MAPPADLPFPSGLHPDQAELQHRAAEVPEEGRLVRGVEVDQGLRPPVRHQRVVGGQQPQPPLQVQVVHVVELPRRHDVVEGGDGVVLEVLGAGLLQRLREARVHGRVERARLAGLVPEDPRRELLAVGEAHRVGAGEGDHLLLAEALCGEEGDHGVHGHVRTGEVALDGGGVGSEAVLAAQRHGVEGPAEHGHQVAGSQR